MLGIQGARNFARGMLLAAVGAWCATFAMSASAIDFSSGGIVSRFTANCTSTKAFHRTILAPVIADAMARHRDDGVAVWGDRAFVFDLNADGHPEYFIPLSCGATGNCIWALVGGEPAKLLDELSAEAIFIHARNEANPWSVVTAYTRSGLPSGVVEQHGFDRQKGRYSKVFEQNVDGIVSEAFRAGIGWPTCGE